MNIYDVSREFGQGQTYIDRVTECLKGGRKSFFYTIYVPKKLTKEQKHILDELNLDHDVAQIEMSLDLTKAIKDYMDSFQCALEEVGL